MTTKKTKKKTTASNTKKPAVVTDSTKNGESEKKPPLKVKTPDGKEVEVKDGDIMEARDDGTFKFENPESLINADVLIICIGMKDNSGNTEILSYPVRIKKCENGNILLRFATADGMDSTRRKMSSVKSINNDEGVCLIGRGQNMEAMFAAQHCWDGYARNFGIDNAYALVRLELEHRSKEWCALFVPVLNVIGE